MWLSEASFRLPTTTPARHGALRFSQSANQPISQSANQPISQSANQPISQSANYDATYHWQAGG
ncbi:hypothetical protein [Erwinia psidii]|uniref:hypothetical protein n=1 Tax=Erwinia psidii TaxID=69224 RepID=UPI0018F63424|nr:hypothetical protein [Erwinia psidii]